MDGSVTYRGKGLHTEKESPDVKILERRAGSVDECLSPERGVQNAKKNVAEKVEKQDKAEENTPRHSQQRMVKIERREQAQTCALDVERAVVVEEPLPALFGYDRTKAEIAVADFLVRRRSKGIINSVFNH